MRGNSSGKAPLTQPSPSRGEGLFEYIGGTNENICPEGSIQGHAQRDV
jgi:hypothetical protein